jgi:hypothetical protein
MTRERLARLGPGLAVGLAAAFLLRRALFAGEAPYWRDINMVWLPQVEVFVRTVAAGALPLWDAFTGFGRPLLADPRAEVFYPLTWLNLLLPPAHFYPLFVAVHLMLGGLGAYRLARGLGASRAAATVGGLAFGATGPLPALALTWHHMAGAAWMPWVLATGLRARRGGAAARRAFALTVALQVFAGSPEYSALSLFALVVLAISVAVVEGERRAPALGRVAAGLGLGLLLAAPQWLPTAAWAAQAQRGALPREAAFVWSLHPLQLVEVVAPVRMWDLPLTPDAQARVLGGREPWLHSVHLGAGLLALALCGLGRRGAGLLVCALAALVLALGPHTPLPGLLLDLVPPLGAFRFPVKAMALFALAVATLAALGAERVAAERARFAALGAAATGALLLAATALPWAEVLAPGADLAVVRGPLGQALGACAALLGAASLPLQPARRLAVVAAIALLPPLWAQRDLLVTTPADFFARRPEALRALELAPGARLYVQDQVVQPSPLPAGDELPRLGLRGTLAGHGRVATAAIGLHLALNPPTAARWGVPGSFDRDILRFEPPFLARLNALLRARESDPAAHARLLALGAVGNVASLTPGPWVAALEPRVQVPTPFVRPLLVWRVPGAVPRVRAVTGVHALPDGADPTVLLEFDPATAVALAAPARAAAGSARVESFSIAPDRLHATIVADAPAHVVFVDAWDPGWSARVDGATAPLLRADGAFRAVPVGPGRHEVELRYWPPGLSAGLVLAGLGLVLLSLKRES